jgi:acyl carrier protein
MSSPTIDGLEGELLELIVRSCSLPDPVPDDFTADEELIGLDSRLGLDSLDAVEIAVALQNRYKVRIDALNTSRMVFKSLRTLAEFVRGSSATHA